MSIVLVFCHVGWLIWKRSDVGNQIGDERLFQFFVDVTGIVVM